MISSEKDVASVLWECAKVGQGAQHAPLPANRSLSDCEAACLRCVRRVHARGTERSGVAQAGAMAGPQGR